MRSLFIRIFLWFWAATVLLVAVLLGSVYLTQPDPQTPHWRALTRSFLALYAQQAAQSYESHGCIGLQSVFESSPFPAFAHHRALTDQLGHSVCGAQNSPQLTSFAHRAAAASSSVFLRETDSVLTATKVRGSSGATYVLLLDLPHFRPPNPLALPIRIWIVRILALLITAGLVCYGLARHFAAPIRRLRAVARRFATGDLKARVGKDPLLKRRDEVAELGRDFDEMARRIEELVTRQEQLLQSQRRLLGDISHELRSPLTRLGLASGLLQRKVGEDAQPLLKRIDLESERLNALIGQLLALARLDAASTPELTETLDLQSLLKDVVDDAAFEAASRNVQIDYEAHENCFVPGIANLLRSAFDNILRNAIRYTAPETVVKVELECFADCPSVIVSDEGPGIPEKDLPHIFEPFYRVAEARDRKSGGTGLGLAITERTIRLHGGTIEALNRPKGGLSVCVSFAAVQNTKPQQATALSDAVVS